MGEERRSRGGSIVFPVILILVGIGFLLSNLGLLPPNWWRQAWQLWPLILVLIGIDLIFGGRGWGWLGLMLSLVIVVGVAAAFWYGVGPGYFRPWAGGASSQVLDEELGNLEQAEVVLEFGAGSLRVGALPLASDSLMWGKLSHEGGGEVTQRFRRSDSRGSFWLRSHGDGSWLPRRAEWQLRLSPRIPLDLTVKVGAADVELDLSELRVRQLHVEAGASSARVRLPATAGRTEAYVKAGAASLELEVPPGVAARIRTNLGLASLSLDERRFPRSGSEYVSPDYDTAANRLNLTIDGGVSSITVR